MLHVSAVITQEGQVHGARAGEAFCMMEEKVLLLACIHHAGSQPLPSPCILFQPCTLRCSHAIYVAISVRQQRQALH